MQWLQKVSVHFIQKIEFKVFKYLYSHCIFYMKIYILPSKNRRKFEIILCFYSLGVIFKFFFPHEGFFFL